jgi:hypothetical protein
MTDHTAAKQPNGAEPEDSGTGAVTGRGPVAVLLTADRYLAAYLTALHPGVTAVADTTDPRAHGLLDAISAQTDPGVVKAGDGLLVLGGGDTAWSVYIGGDIDDAGIWSRAVAVQAEFVAILPDGEDWLRDQLADHLGAGPSGMW